MKDHTKERWEGLEQTQFIQQRKVRTQSLKKRRMTYLEAYLPREPHSLEVGMVFVGFLLPPSEDHLRSLLSYGVEEDELFFCFLVVFYPVVVVVVVVVRGGGRELEASVRVDGVRCRLDLTGYSGK